MKLLMRGLAGLLVSAMALGCGAGPDRTGVTIFPDMRASVPYDAYDANPVLAGGLTSMRPPDGTVATNGAPFLFGNDVAEAERAGRELQNPLLGEAADLARGKQVFDTMCAVCHGPGGAGDGRIIGRFPNPPSLLADKTRQYPDGRVYHVIARGQGLMPSYAAQVQHVDRWRLVLYVRSLQAAAAPAAASAPEPEAATAETVIQ